LNNPAAQEAAVRAYHKALWGQLISWDATSYIGTEFQGVVVTESGLLAAAHLKGAKGVSDALKAGKDIYDGNNTYISDYMRSFGGYRLW
jgi:hypothetical protein